MDTLDSLRPLMETFSPSLHALIVPSGEIGVSFSDVGALDEVKDVLQEVVMSSLQRPELFNKGGLIKSCEGVLMFGPPRTSKTMLAKAVATEAGASFINVSMSTITSKWFGEDEKTVKALFTLAAKVAPTIIFIDEVIVWRKIVLESLHLVVNRLVLKYIQFNLLWVTEGGQYAWSKVEEW